MATTKPKEAQNLSRTKPMGQTQKTTKQTAEKEKSSSICISTEKHVPNYLRPTISSRPEPLKQHTGRKNVLEEQKLLRRRSFDRPLSSTPRVQKSLISPGPRERASISCRDKMVAGLRSSSFPAKGNNALKPSLDNKAAKTPVKTTGKSPQPVLTPSRGVKKGVFAATTKKEQPACSHSHSHSASSSRKIVHGIHDHTAEYQTSSPEARHEEKDSPVLHEDEEIVKLESTDHAEVILPDQASKTQNENHDDPVVIEVDVDHHEEEEIINNQYTSTTPETFQTDYHRTEDETPNYKLADENVLDVANYQHEDSKNQSPIKVDEVSTEPDHQKAENSSEETKIEDREEEPEVHERDGKEVSSGNYMKQIIDDDHADQGGGHQEDYKEEEGLISSQDGVKSKEGESEDLNGVVDDVKLADDEEVASTVVKRAVGGGQGKKESPGAYNNVIEETASKLLKKRKNKVKALVGAFETVIDYETAASK